MKLILKQKVRVIKMKKLLTSIGRFFGKIFKFLYKILDVIIIVPLSKFFYFIGDKLSSKNGGFEKFLNNPNTLIYLSLFFAFIMAAISYFGSIFICKKKKLY